MNFEIVAAVNNEEIFKNNLKNSPLIRYDKVKLHAEIGFKSASSAYLSGLQKCTKDIVVFAHQDVYIPQGWDQLLASAILALEAKCCRWGVLGPFGIDKEGSYCGQVWSSGLAKVLNYPVPYPHEVVSVDELLIVLNRKSGVTFDINLPAFHLYGTDIILEAKKNDFKSFVFYGPVIHNSTPVRYLGARYGHAYKYLARKWSTILPLRTCIVPVTQYGLPLWRSRLKSLIRIICTGRRFLSQRDPVVLARELEYEN